MTSTPWDKRFLVSTRGRILALLRRESRTVEDLAQGLGLTDNAIRTHLATLERDGLVEHTGTRRTGEGAGKPAYIYGLTPEAEQLFPKAFELVLRALLDALVGEVDAVRLEELLRSAGHRIAEQQATGVAVPMGDLRARLDRAVGLLNDLGGLVELEERDGAYHICGYICPLSDMPTSYPQLCRLVQTLIADLVDAPVKEQCERSEALRCWFEVPAVQ